MHGHWAESKPTRKWNAPVMQGTLHEQSYDSHAKIDQFWGDKSGLARNAECRVHSAFLVQTGSGEQCGHHAGTQVCNISIGLTFCRDDPATLSSSMVTVAEKPTLLMSRPAEV